MALEKELNTFHIILPEMLSQGAAGKYVLIHESQVAGTYDTHELALQAGYDNFELKPFLIKQ